MLLDSVIIEQKQSQINQLIEIGHALTTEKNFNVLMEKILIAAKTLSNADAGTLYMVSDDAKFLEFKVVQTDSLKTYMGGSRGHITWAPLSLYKDDGSQNKEMVAALCALSGEAFDIPDVYEAEGFNFEGTKAFDKRTGYRTKSMLIVPMKNHENDVIGVLQLLNKKNALGEIISFDEEDEKLIQSLASQAAVSITNNNLIDDFEELLDSFIRSIASAIDEKSKYTGGHIGRVAEIALLIVDAINEDDQHNWKKYNEDEKKELMYAAWMHDIGKITTPEFIVDKATKLHTMFDRIEFIKIKFELFKASLQIDMLKGVITQFDYEQQISVLDNDLSFLISINKGGEFMADEMVARLHQIGAKTFSFGGITKPLLDDNELFNLSIKKGTLTDAERKIINNHALVSLNMLNKLHFPKKLKRVPEIAAGHHEKICGGGYPLGLKGEDISFETRILAIADIFEALTASDRPYKNANTLNQALKILYFMTKDGELDRELVKFFIEKELYMKYAKNNFKQEQFDEVTVNFDTL